ncbi:TPA: AAA family ATPase [Campylobacter lari]|uniref:Endonuclease n=2 Tax=Campylobacter lari TaxID=201 RepID=A0A5L8LLU6_CAMLA|nr:AAA family ATPase [Campylobacter lari]EAH5177356.1 endonuclease [Campylobacter lari]EAH6292775.1 endonuclease [Campylobacter lari]EAH7837687.1 endonuclease [Campylobacter lari]EAI2083095.1 endonuclease [Campylobacter lari]EAI2315387.1 endonuclease [Campylobacter lari]
MNINLNEEQKKNIENKFLEFQRIWTLEKVKSMTLEEYTSIKKDNPDRNDFTFWIENKLDDIGSIWGGSSFKFGIYKRNSNDDKENLKGKTYNDNYAWLSKYGNNQDEAFNKIKQTIIDIIQASKNNNLETIENIDFGDATKWKIAFHYQNVENIKIVNIFSKNVLDLISLNEFKEKLKIYQIYEKLLENKNLSLIEMIENMAIPLWVEYGINIKKMKKLFCEYLSKRNIDTSSIKKYASAVENISNEFLKDNLYSCNLYNFDQNIEKLNKNNKFVLKNNNGNKMYSVALKHYRTFLYNFERQFLNNEIMDKELNMKNPPLNQILYGPPGTGKTYHTIDKALEILNENLENRDDKKVKFDEYVKNGQIVFTTFHQSYGYEEFVEGIKPHIDREENSKKIEYEIKDGIFKELCEKALDKKRKINNDISIDKNSKVWKISLGANASLRDECFEKNKICIGWNDIPKNKDERFLNLGSNDKNSIISFVEYMQIGDLVCVFNTSKTIKGVGVIVSDVKYSDGEYQTYREVKWISKDNEINILDLNNDKILVQKTVYELYRISSNDLLAKINLNNPKDNTNNLEIAEDNTKKKFIIIIDEINRGNVSKIFGELITLIEPSKRIGEEEEIKVKLPYSGKDFGVPKNVYIIGTMNTADRSITSLDTALRRRFEFIEMMPKPNVLSDNCEGVNLQELLKAINTRIEYLLDREKTIGHAFFIGIDNLEKLKNVFQNKIIPLLQEYFYNDYALIDAVLNENGMLEKQDTNNDYLKNMTDFIESDKVIYKFSDSQKWDENTFKKIYE